MKEERGENEENQNCGIRKGRAVPGEQEIQHRCADDNDNHAELFSQRQRGIDQLPETMSILPNPAADRNQADTDTNIGEDIDRALHGIGDGEIGVITLLQSADDEDAAAKTDDLDERLDDREIPHQPRLLKGAANRRTRPLIEQRRERTEKIHSAIQFKAQSAGKVPATLLRESSARKRKMSI